MARFRSLCRPGSLPAKEKEIKAVIFDLDGLLADTERLHFEAYRRAFAACGVALAEDDYSEYWVRRGFSVAAFIVEKKLNIDADAVRRTKIEHYQSLLRLGLQPMPGAREALMRLHGHKRLALASSSYRHDVNTVLATLGFAPFFATTVAREEVKNLKPAPDPFLLAAKQLGVAANQCVVVEDAEKGLRAAHAAGMPCLVVPNRYTCGNDFALAYRVLGSLAELTVELIDSIASCHSRAPGKQQP